MTITDVSSIEPFLDVLRECNRVKQTDWTGSIQDQPLGMQWTLRWEPFDTLGTAETLRLTGSMKFTDSQTAEITKASFEKDWIFHQNGGNLLVLQRSHVRDYETTQRFSNNVQDGSIPKDKVITSRAFFKEAPEIIEAFDAMVAENQG
jgi:hypothetical protein